MAKVKVFKQSGSLVDAEAQEQFNKEWALLYDKIEAKVEQIYNKKSGKLQLVPTHILMQRFTQFAERQLFKKYAVDVEVELPKTAKAWNTLVNKYQGTPLMVAQRQDGKGLVLVIMDTLGS